MIFRNHAVTRVGAGFAGLLAAGAFAAPAYAGTSTDLELTVVGTKLAAGSEGKIGFAKITNKGEGTPTALTVTADFSALDPDKMVAFPFVGDECEGDLAAGKVTCAVPADLIPGPGQTLDYPVVVLRNPEVAAPYTGEVTFTISSPDDSTPDNNTKTVEVAISEESGPDLSVFAPDVTEAAEVDAKGKLHLKGELNPGETAALRYEVANFGDVATTGLKITVKLPKGVTFTEVEPDCVYAADNMSTVCTYNNFPLVPADQDTDENDKIYSAYGFYKLLSVSADVDAPVSLTGGTVSVEPVVAASPAIKALTDAPKLPENVEGMSAADVDESDNTDEYTVVVKAAGGEGGGGGLPVTGTQAGVIGAVGAGVLVVGGVLFLSARRRRVVLVTPGDEKPTA